MEEEREREELQLQPEQIITEQHVVPRQMDRYNKNKEPGTFRCHGLRCSQLKTSEQLDLQSDRRDSAHNLPHFIPRLGKGFCSLNPTREPRLL